jgi:hypothetical protein
MSQYARYPALGGGGGSGVSSLNGESGSLTILPGTGINVITGPGTITIVNTESGGSVTDVSVVTANGFAGTVTNPTTTPALTLSTTVTGILYGNGTSVAAAIAANFPILNQNTTGTASNITATSNSTLTTLSALSLPASQLTGLGNITDDSTAGLMITGGVGAVIGGGVYISQAQAGTAQNGYLSSTDWNTFNNKQSTITTGNLTDGTSDGITITGGTGAVIGSGTTISQQVATASQNGYLASTDWTTFNNKQAAGNYITSLTGDVTGSGPGATATTLATVNSNIGSFGTATAVSTMTVNAKGLVTAASNTSIQIAESQVTNLVSDLAGKQPTGNYITALTGQVTASGPGSVAATIATNTVTNSNLAQMPADTIKGNNTGSTANASDLTVTQARSLIGIDSGASFITSGTTYTTPSIITTATQFKFTLVGGGGGGGAGNTTAANSGSGAGGGGTGILYISGLSPSTGYTIAIGGGGGGGTGGGTGAPTAGAAGGNTSITISSTTYTANGGSAGPANGGTGGSGGTVNLWRQYRTWS